MNKYILILSIFFVFSINIFTQEVNTDVAIEAENTDQAIEDIIIENYDDAKEAYTLALFYIEKAIASRSLDEEARLNLQQAASILTEVVKFIPEKEIYFELAETYEALYQIELAFSVYEELLDIYPYDEKVLFRIGERCLFFMADFAKAEYYLKTALSIEENNNNLILIGYLFYEKRDYVNASKYFSKIDITKGGQENYLDYYNFYYAVSEFNKGNFKKTLECLEKLNLNKISEVEKTQAVFMKSKSYQALEQYKKAYQYIKSDEARSVMSDFYFEAFLSALAGEYDSKLFAEVIDTYNTPKIIWVAYTANTESIKDAVNMIETDIDRNNIDLDIIQYYYLLVDKVGNDNQKKQAEIDIIEFYIKNKIYESIEKHIDTLIKKYPEISEYKNVYIKMAQNYISAENNPIEAKKSLQKYLNIASKEDIKHYFDTITHLILSIKDYELAKEFLNKAENQNILPCTAFLYSKFETKENTIKYIEEAYENMDYDDYNLMYLFQAVTETKDKELITKYGEEFSESGSFLLINNYSWALINQDIDYDKGIDYIEMVLEDNKNAVYMDTLAWGYYKKGEYEKALNIFLEAALTIPKENEAEIYSHIADVYYKMGDNEKALLNYRHSKIIDYKSEDYDENYVNSQIEKLKK